MAKSSDAAHASRAGLRPLQRRRPGKNGSRVSEEAESRLSYLAATLDLLWPDTGTTGVPQRVVLPNLRTPRLLVPVRPRRAGASAVIRYTAQQPVIDRLGSIVLAGAVAFGWAARLPKVRTTTSVQTEIAESIDTFLSGALGTSVLTSLALTRQRVNRKPVLQVFDTQGHTIAFAKIGVDPLTRHLVDTEAATLRDVRSSGITGLEVPEVLFHGSWKGASVLVLSVLRRGARISSPNNAVDRVMRAVSSTTKGRSTIKNEYIQATRESATRAAGGPRGSQLTEWLNIFEDLVAKRPVEDLPIGAWHGDWTEWNCAARRGVVQLWDWERYQRAVPLGFDKLHFLMNHAVGPGRDRFSQAAEELISDSPRILGSWGVSAAVARTTAMLYILQLALRYLLDNAPIKSFGSRIDEWAFPTIRAALSTADPHDR